MCPGILVSPPGIKTCQSIWKPNEPPSPKPSQSPLSPLNRCVGKQMKTFSNGSNPCERKNLYCQKCEVAQRSRATNGAENRSTPHLCQLNIRRRPGRSSRPIETDRSEAGKRCSCRDCSKARLRAAPDFFAKCPGVQCARNG